ncbi:hypothetical protein D3C80_1700030 [compost metagenome]
MADGFDEDAWSDLPRNPPFVLAPAANAGLAVVADNGIPQAVGLCLVHGTDLERKCLTVLEGRSTIEPHARDTHYREFHGDHIALLA